MNDSSSSKNDTPPASGDIETKPSRQRQKAGWISRDKAIKKLLAVVTKIQPSLVAPQDGIGYIAANNITAHCDVPEQACSLRDGYALRSNDIAKAAPMDPVQLPVTQTVRAESLQAAPVAPGTTARVLTGGMVPPCADAVLAEEDVEIHGENIFVRTPVRSGWFIRPAGGEITQDDTIIRAGEVITPQAAAVMIRTRVNSVLITRKPTARIIALGSELSNPMCCGTEDCDGGRFPADNLVLAKGLLEQGGATVTQTDVLPDIEDRLIRELNVEDLPDIIITTGGTGRSERDFARSSALEAGFTTIVDNVDIRPGKNMFAAYRENTILIGLPGPPAAVFACFHGIILPIIRAMRGLPKTEPIKAKLDKGVSAKPGCEWLLLCTLRHQGADIIATPLFGKEMPPMLAMGQAHGVVVLQGGTSAIPGDEFEIVSTKFE